MNELEYSGMTARPLYIVSYISQICINTDQHKRVRPNWEKLAIFSGFQDGVEEGSTARRSARLYQEKPLRGILKRTGDKRLSMIQAETVVTMDGVQI